MRGSRLLPLALALVTAVLLQLPAQARADGDPASDTLILKTLYTPVTQAISPPVLQRLEKTIAAANTAGLDVRVALVLGKTDLGAVPQLFGHPVQYAHLLAGELYFAWKGGIVAVQPAGVGVRNFTPLAAAQKIATGVKVAQPATSDALANAADQTIRELAAAKGYTLPGLHPLNGATTASSGVGRWLVGGVVFALIVLALAGAAALRLRRRAGR